MTNLHIWSCLYQG